MAEEDTRAMFIRQRRNLMGMTIIILAITCSGLSFSKLNILGNEFNVDSPNMLNAALWVVFGYWGLRYFQYMHQQGNTGIYSTFSRKLLNIYLPYVHEALNKNIAEKMGGLAYRVHTNNTEQWIDMPGLFSPYMKYKVRVFYQVTLEYPNGSTKQGSPDSMDIEMPNVHVNGFKAWWSAFNYTAWRTPLVSEYVLPPAFAFTTILAANVYYSVIYFWPWF